MAVLAVGLAVALRFDALAAKNVHPLCDSLKMPWVNAAPHTTFVVKLKTCGDGPVLNLVSSDVRTGDPVDVASTPDLAISVLVAVPEPEEAARIRLGHRLALEARTDTCGIFTGLTGQIGGNGVGQDSLAKMDARRIMNKTF